MESVRTDIAFVVLGVLGGLVLLVCAARVVALNSGSQNLILSYGAVVGIVFAFLVSSYFELKSRNETTGIGINCPIDREEHKIGSAWLGEHATRLSSERLEFDNFTSAWLSDNAPWAFDGDTKRLTADFAIYCILGLFANGRNHWNLERLDVRGPRSVSSFWMSRGRKGREAERFISLEEIFHLLAGSGNLFARARPPFLARGFTGLSAPPSTCLRVLPASVFLSNPVCSVEFRIFDDGVVVNVPPVEPAPVPHRQSASPLHGQRFETRAVRVTIETVFNPLRSKSRYIEDYQEWVSRIVERARVWFEGEPQ